MDRLEFFQMLAEIEERRDEIRLAARQLVLMQVAIIVTCLICVVAFALTVR